MVSRWLSVCPSVRLSFVRTSVRISFPDGNLSKYQWIFIKFGLCIDIIEIWFGIVNGQIVIFCYLPATGPNFHFRVTTLVNINEFLRNLVCGLILWRSALGFLMGNFHHF